ncbi:HpcH/HpaI aldolase/citrate lyase family protein [Stappia sp.]|uniref:HpcH/HpaI aldolase/citrate lyase family protein n=1 Tax=Stappia sp. TaxID=1870903 RepID=UPI003A9A0B8E
MTKGRTDAVSAALDTIALPLFVPGNRPERFAKALSAGADAVIIDLEDAVPPSAKDEARAGLARALADLSPAVPLLVRVNAAGTAWHDQDLAACAELPLAGVVVAKAEDALSLEHAARRAGAGVIALVESASGLAAAHEIARASQRIAFGSIDFAADLGIAHERETLAHARFALALAARLAGQAAPIDGVTTDIRDAALIEADCRHAVGYGFAGKLLIHPAQIGPARAGFAPSPEEAAWARRIVDAAGDGTAAVAVDGAMVDAPVVIRARQILDRLAAHEASIA